MLGVKNRFAALKIDDDEDEKSKSKIGSSNQNQSNSAAKKKNKKKKEEQEALRTMAFGTGRPVGGKQPKQPGSAGQQRGNKSGKAEDWDDWQRRDQETTEDMYQTDLQQALLDSKIEAEHKKEIQKTMSVETHASTLSVDKKGGGKKNKKGKPQAMSLGQFNKLPAATIPGSDEEEVEDTGPAIVTRVPIESQDKLYFENVASDASRILQKERIQKDYQKAYAHEAAMQSKYLEKIEKLKEKNKEWKTRCEELTTELKSVKNRNARLCKIVGDGEMKEKTAILEQVEELTTDKADLTEQLSAMTAELEKERSKNHTLKLEIDKFKGKHSK